MDLRKLSFFSHNFSSEKNTIQNEFRTDNFDNLICLVRRQKEN